MSAGNDELIVAFITEATEGLAGIENDFLLMEEGGEDIDTDLVNKIFRAIHSMKGTSGFLGLKSIGLLAHEMENALNLIRSNELVPTSMVVEALLKGADALSAMIADIENSDEFDVSGHIDAIRAAISGEASEDIQEALNRDVDIELPDGGGLVFMLICEQELVSRQKRGCHIYVIDADLIGDVHDKGRTPLDFLRDLYDAGELIDSYVSTAGIGGLSDALPEKLSLMNLVASELPAEKLAEQLQIPAAQVYHIAAPEQYNWSSGQPEFVAEALIPTGVKPAPAPAGQPKKHFGTSACAEDSKHIGKNEASSAGCGRHFRSWCESRIRQCQPQSECATAGYIDEPGRRACPWKKPTGTDYGYRGSGRLGVGWSQNRSDNQ